MRTLIQLANADSNSPVLLSASLLAAPLLPKTPPIALALTPNAVKTLANPTANANVGNIVLELDVLLLPLLLLSFFLLDDDSSDVAAAVEMYDTVIGNRPNEHGLIDVHKPAVYNIPNDFIDSTIFIVVEDDEDDEEV
jgi:hypothetical protein